MKLASLKANPNNPRIIKDEKFARLKKSLEEFPQMMTLRPIVVDESGMILGGNMRFAALKANGLKEIPDEWVKRASELTEEQKKEFIIKDNNSFGEYNWDVLANEWSDLPLSDWGVDLPQDWLQTEEPRDAEPQIDKAAELQQKWQVTTGEIIEIGRHRLMCGDSTRKTDTEALLAGNRPLLMVTDPPYGVDYDPTWRDRVDKKGLLGNRKAVQTGQVANDERCSWGAAYELFEGAVAYVWHADKHALQVQTDLEAARFQMVAQVVWAKPQGVFGRGDYHWQHEPCWYAVRKGQTHHWIGDCKQTTLWDVGGMSPFGHSADAQDKATTHGTQKPLECMARPIRNHEGDVYDPFVGSGTTLVAAENLNRTCYAMEISPEYCAVILERMTTAFPGIEIKRESQAVAA